ncbi:MAG: acylphosphatase [Proteobacteria bacterium]|nr:acylphosphatase [Pseudomonadota bacterium]
MHIRRQIFVSGRVQGVFFRDSTRQLANKLKLGGGVRNCSDGRVEVQVFGPETDVQTLIKWLKIGPKYAKVSTIEVIDLPIHPAEDPLQGLSSSYFEVWQTK